MVGAQRAALSVTAGGQSRDGGQTSSVANAAMPGTGYGDGVIFKVVAH